MHRLKATRHPAGKWLIDLSQSLHALAARVVGDSMSPDYREGEIVVFSPAAPVTDGTDCFIRLERDAEMTFKRVSFEDDGDTVVLHPVNPKYESRRVARNDIAALYAAVYVLRRVTSSKPAQA